MYYLLKIYTDDDENNLYIWLDIKMQLLLKYPRQNYQNRSLSFSSFGLLQWDTPSLQHPPVPAQGATHTRPSRGPRAQRRASSWCWRPGTRRRTTCARDTEHRGWSREALRYRRDGEGLPRVDSGLGWPTQSPRTWRRRHLRYWRSLAHLSSFPAAYHFHYFSLSSRASLKYQRWQESRLDRDPPLRFHMNED